ncbi:VanW family protein [Streptomyces sp. CNQ-509]|uniref:VanW family protein n=1 Tax=unclassified Streptomyces TaxID=2593676 RepID=UPI00062DF142|nr:VanW family protein [Streptomyces sp. CNQ-509]AKH85826.1 VanW family protein [Streptomyces sp. CNQ-509]
MLPSPGREAPDSPPAGRYRRPLVAGVAAAAVFGFLYVLGLLVGGDDIPSGTRVLDLDIGGMSRAEAAEKLERNWAELVPDRLPVRMGDETGELGSRAAGVTLDAEATVDDAAQSGSGPFTVIGRLFSGGGGDVEPVIRVDGEKSRAALASLAESYDREVRDGSITFHGGEPTAVQPRAGRSLDVDGALAELQAAAPDREDGPLALPVREVEPAVGAEEVDRAMAGFAAPAMSGPVTLTVRGGGEIEIAPEVLGEHLAMEPDGSDRLTPRLDGRGLFRASEVAAQVEQVSGEAENARLRWDGERVVVATEAAEGREITQEALAKAVLELLPGEGADARTGPVATRVDQPQLTGENAGRLGIKEQMSAFTVEFPPAPYRTQNVGQAAKLIDGSVVMPDDTWSFNDTVGERTEANGFVEGIIILDGKYTRATGGGVSAVATTVFNAAFFAGVDFEEYGAHSFYIERYPEGREATVAWGSLDLTFRNDSGNAIYVEASATEDSVTISFLGTRKYDEIESVKGPRTNVVEAGTRKGDADACEPQTPLEGFDVEVERIFKSGGREVDRESFKTTYTPRDSVTCE